MKFPLVRRTALEDTELRLRELTQEYQNFRRRNADTQTNAYHSGRLPPHRPSFQSMTIFCGLWSNPVRTRPMSQASA